jgi:hypothetical protein
MKTVEEIIGDLLLRNNCVIVPSFGGFVANQTSAIIDYTNGIMTPPRKSVLFNRQLINNDGLLIKEVSILNALDYSDATALVKNKVEEWNYKLVEGERITLDKVGYIFLDAEKNICFEQDRFFNLLLESYGLGKVHFISDEDVRFAQHTVVIEHPTLSVEEKPLFVVETSNIDVLPLETEERPFVEIEHPAAKKTIKVWKYVAAAVLLPIAFYTYWLPMKTNVLESGIISIKDFNPMYKTAEGKYVKETIKVVDLKKEGDESLENSIEKIPSDVATYAYKFSDDIYINVRLKESSKISTKEEVKSAELVTPELVSNKSVPASPNVKKAEVKKSTTKQSFDLVVGAFGSVENANKLVSDLKSKGFSAKIVDKNGALYRVSSGTTSDLQAIQKIKEDAKTVGVDGWILKK